MPVVTTSVTVVRNTLANGLGGVVGTILGLVLTPFVVRQLGLEAYGVWTLALTLSFAGGYAALTDIGIETATVREVAEAQAVDDHEKTNEVVATTLVFFGTIGAVLALAVVATAPLLVDAFSVDHALRGAALFTFMVIGLQLLLELPARAFTAVLEGTQNFITYQAVELGKGLFNAAGTVVVLVTGGDLHGLAVVYALMTALGFLTYWTLAHRAVPGLRASPRRASRVELRKLLGYGTTVFGLRSTGIIHRQMDKIILGAGTDARYVALYEFANKLQMAAAQIQSMSVSALTPATAHLRRHREVLRDLYLRGTLYTTAVSLPVALGAIIFAEPLLRDWIGPKALDAVSPARLFIIYLLYTVFNNVGVTMLVALGRLRRLVQLAFTALTINLVVSIATVHALKTEGVILGTLVGGAVTWLPTLRLGLQEFEVSVGTWLRRVVLPQLAPCLALGAAGLPLLALVHEHHNLLLDGAAFALSVAVAIAAFLAVGVRGEDRRVLLRTFLPQRGGEAPAAAAGPEAS